MNKVRYLLPLLFIFLIGCSAEITEEDLIGGYWIGTAGYKDGEPEGDPYCLPFIIEGLEFKDESTVYAEDYDRDFEYWLEDSKNGTVINFRGKNHYVSYYIDMIDEDEIGLTGEGEIQQKESCYLERQK